jgi:hypothetical protein
MRDGATFSNIHQHGKRIKRYNGEENEGEDSTFAYPYKHFRAGLSSGETKIPRKLQIMSNSKRWASL